VRSPRRASVARSRSHPCGAGYSAYRLAADALKCPAAGRDLGPRLEALATRLRQYSNTSQRPPSAESPYKKARQTSGSSPRRKAGGQPGHTGYRQRLLAQTDMCVLPPPPCTCGNTALVGVKPYHTHQVIDLPPIQMEVSHFVLQQAWCALCAQWTKAQIPPEHAAGYGPRLTALMGEMAGTHGTGRRTLQTFCASVLQVPLSLGAIQKMLDRVLQAITPHHEAIARQARQARVNYIDEIPWFLTTTL